MKKMNIKKFLVLFTMIICVFSMTACTDTISSGEAKTSTKQMQVDAYSGYMKAWATDMLTYLNTTDDAQIKSDAEAGYTIAMVNGKQYLINMNGIDNKTIEFYNSWVKTKQNLGDFVSIDSMDIETSSETGTLCTIVVKTTYEKRGCTFELVINDDCNLSSGAINPDYTIGEKGEKAILNTVLGMGTVFCVLIFISFIISLFKYVNKIGQKKSQPEEKKAAPAPVPVVEEAVESDETDDEELVAVIAAAIAAAEGTSPDGLVVRSIRKVERKNSWK